MDKKIKVLMHNLNITKEQALQVIEDDKAIDRGERLPFDLSKEDEKKAKKWANVGEKTKKTERKAPNRKKNEEKALIIAKLNDFLAENEDFEVENLEITNAEREISFNFKGKSFSLILSQHR